MALPAIRALLKTFPGRMTLLARKGMAEKFFHGLAFQRLIEVDVRPGDHSYQFDPAVAELVDCRDALFVDLNTWYTEETGEFIRRIQPRATIGISNPAYDYPLPLDLDKHTMDLLFDIPRAVDPTLRMLDFVGPPEFSAAATATAARICSLLPREFRWLAVHTETLENKQWPLERFHEVLDGFLERRPEFIAIVVDGNDRGLRRGRHAQRIIPVSRYSLPAMSLVVAQCELFLGIDSYFLHAADLFRVPGVAVFGPTDPKEWGFRLVEGRHLRGQPPSEVAASDVLEALLSLGGNDAADHRVGHTPRLKELEHEQQHPV